MHSSQTQLAHVLISALLAAFVDTMVLKLLYVLLQDQWSVQEVMTARKVSKEMKVVPRSKHPLAQTLIFRLLGKIQCS